jgi:hypothetical protein
MNEALISDSGRQPVVVQRRDTGGLAISWGGKLLALSPSEIGRVLAFINRDPTAVSPCKARLLKYSVPAKET